MTTFATVPSPAACSACSTALSVPSLLCASCGSVRAVSRMDYFQAFGLPRSTTVDTAALEREFHRLSRKLHPDRFVNAPEEEREASLAATALLNDAYRTLRDPVKRIEYLLRLEGFEIGEEHAGKNKSANRQPPPDLLEEVFDLNMQLEEMRMNHKIGEEDPALTADLTKAKARFEGLLAEVDADLTREGAVWDEGDAASRATAATKLAALLDRRRYLRNLVRDTNEVLSTPAV